MLASQRAKEKNGGSAPGRLQQWFPLGTQDAIGQWVRLPSHDVFVESC